MQGSCVARPYLVRCPEGHEMRAKVAREMLQLMRCTERPECGACESELTDSDAYYHCKACHFDYCMTCSRMQLGLSSATRSEGELLELEPGDILLCGPDRYDIHHVILVRGELEPAPEELSELLRSPPGAQLFLCPTIESTQGQKGRSTWWYPTTSILERDAHSGTAALVGDMPPDSESLMVAEEPVPLKVLLHPLRPERSGEAIDLDVFHDVLDACAAKSKRYSWGTAAGAFFAYQRSLHAGDYSGEEARAALLQRLCESWERPPICAAVAITVWQQYLLASSSEQDEATQRILRWMPLWCNRTTPSAMVKTLTHHEWGLYGSLEA